MAMMTEMIRMGLINPLYAMIFVEDPESFRLGNLDDKGFHDLVDRYGQEDLQSTRAALAWVAKNPGYDYKLTWPDMVFLDSAQMYVCLRRFHEALEEQIAKHKHTFEVQFHQPVEYLTDIGQAMLRADVVDGLLVGMNGPVDTTQSYRLFHPLGSGGIYVMRADGELIIADYGDSGVRYHSALAKGEPVICAGFINVVDGKIVSIDRLSGHYETTPEMLQNALAELAGKGVDTSTIAVNDTERMGAQHTAPAITEADESIEPNSENRIIVGPHQVLRTILYELFYLDDLDTFAGIDNLGIHRLKNLYTYEEVEQFRMALDWAMVCDDFDFTSLLPNLPYGNEDIVRYLRIFHETLEAHAINERWLDIEWTGFDLPRE